MVVALSVVELYVFKVLRRPVDGWRKVPDDIKVVSSNNINDFQIFLMMAKQLHSLIRMSGSKITQTISNPCFRVLAAFIDWQQVVGARVVVEIVIVIIRL